MSRTDVPSTAQGQGPGPVLGVVGWSGSGKTTLLEGLVARLAQDGLRVNIVKHSHHDIELEPPRKDSARLRLAGAAEVMIASPYRIAIMRELRAAPEPGLVALLARLSPADLTLVEGYKWEALPKLEVHRPSLGKPPLFRDDATILAVVSDVARPVDARAGLAWLDLNDLGGVVDWVCGWLKTRPQVSVDGAVKD
ncbi:molybdopterin-guanine dinucleotide biosynthesis protein B [Massilia sp. CFBP9012]|uniref:molybdopterin-guanine dinucleotide biosynthesis protein B n=1 Tax=Massilia sp. CFBP9012 TaxID=3096531 RepID=UPI002A6A203F|nr:molybdopterin-guanine dinucleotide biosynthesis protein B [Massilia sp. CFBP9012]MDY0974956.1 molybdopterin-guanine dinucleotide biosynthesis protein B [Massilia sp. CFBP9012]